MTQWALWDSEGLSFMDTQTFIELLINSNSSDVLIMYPMSKTPIRMEDVKIGQLTLPFWTDSPSSCDAASSNAPGAGPKEPT